MRKTLLAAICSGLLLIVAPATSMAQRGHANVGVRGNYNGNYNGNYYGGNWGGRYYGGDWGWRDPARYWTRFGVDLGLGVLGYRPYYYGYGYGYPYYGYNYGYSYPYYSYSYPSYDYTYAYPSYDYTYSAPAAGPTTSFYSPTTTSAGYDNPNAANLEVMVPPNARLFIDGQAVAGSGEQRRFFSPPLQPGQNYVYHIRAEWTDPSGKVVDRERSVDVHAGARIGVDMNR